MVYNGQWFSALHRELAAYLKVNQEHVTGKVRVKLHKGSCTVVGRESPKSLYQMHLATYGQEDAYDHDAAIGFIKIHGLSQQTQARIQLAAPAKHPSCRRQPTTNDALEGRFGTGGGSEAIKFTSSFPFDRRFYKEDIAASTAHAEMLGATGIISQDQSEAIVSGLSRLRLLIDEQGFPDDADDEDIFSFVERRLGEMIGDPARALHTARSRKRPGRHGFPALRQGAVPSCGARDLRTRRVNRLSGSATP